MSIYISISKTTSTTTTTFLLGRGKSLYDFVQN